MELASGGSLQSSKSTPSLKLQSKWKSIYNHWICHTILTRKKKSTKTTTAISELICPPHSWPHFPLKNTISVKTNFAVQLIVSHELCSKSLVKNRLWMLRFPDLTGDRWGLIFCTLQILFTPTQQLLKSSTWHKETGCLRHVKP
jgi:hypothetical protein